MKKSSFIFAVLFSSFTSLNAEDFYIKLMSARYKDTMYDTAKKFHLMGYKIHLFQYEEWNRIYTGPFSSHNNAKEALYIIQKNGVKDAYIVTNKINKNSSYPIYLQDAYIVKNFKHKQTNTTSSQTIDLNQQETSSENDSLIVVPIQKKASKVEAPVTANQMSTNIPSDPEVSIASEKNTVHFVENTTLNNVNMFLGTTIGYSKVNVKETDLIGSLTLDSSLDENGVAYGVEAGYYFNDSIFMSLNYQLTRLDDVKFDNMYATLNYKFDEVLSIKPYVGAILGYSKMTWDQNPLNASNSNNESSSYLAGIQIGADNYIADQLALYISYQYLMMEHTTKLKTFLEEKELEHNSQQNLNIGIKYFF